MFIQLLDLEQSGEGRFVAPLSPDKGERLYGGQYLAQGLHAAQATLAAGFRTHSLHGYFLRPGDVDEPLSLQVEKVRDGRSFATRQVVAEQRGKTLFRMLASFQVPVDTPRYVGRPMPDVPPPEAVSYTYDDFTLAQTGKTDWYGAARPMEILYVNPPHARRGEAITETQLMWMRIRGSLPETPAVHQAALAYLSDSTLVDHVMLPLGLRWQDEDFEGASLDHAMWFHDPVRADDWLLYAQTVEATGHGRGLVSGRFYDRSGRLAATCVQEGLMRWRAGQTTRRAGE